MIDELFCVICESKKEDMSKPVVYSGVCPKCSNKTLYVDNLSKWVCIKKSNGDYDFFNIIIDNSDYVWVEIYEGEYKYKKLVNTLISQVNVKIIKNDPYGTFVYSRNGHQFQIMLIHYVDYLLSQSDWWDGKPFIEFAFVKKEDPNFEIYKQELKILCDIL